MKWFSKKIEPHFFSHFTIQSVLPFLSNKEQKMGQTNGLTPPKKSEICSLDLNFALFFNELGRGIFSPNGGIFFFLFDKDAFVGFSSWHFQDLSETMWRAPGHVWRKLDRGDTVVYLAHNNFWDEWHYMLCTCTVTKYKLDTIFFTSLTVNKVEFSNEKTFSTLYGKKHHSTLEMYTFKVHFSI